MSVPIRFMETEDQEKEYIEIEVAYAVPAVQVVKRIKISNGTSLGNAIPLSGIVDEFPEIDLFKSRVGIFGKLSKLETILKHNDRVEIYRSLLIDPKDARRLRVTHKKT